MWQCFGRLQATLRNLIERSCECFDVQPSCVCFTVFVLLSAHFRVKPTHTLHGSYTHSTLHLILTLKHGLSFVHVCVASREDDWYWDVLRHVPLPICGRRACCQHQRRSGPGVPVGYPHLVPADVGSKGCVVTLNKKRNRTPLLRSAGEQPLNRSS
jgi:hypothetical protein